MITVIGVNCMIASLVCLAASKLWRWRQNLQQLTHSLEASLEAFNLAPGEWRYALTYQRLNLAQTRFALARLQQRSHQIHQAWQLFKLIQTAALLYRSGYPAKRAVYLRKPDAKAHTQRNSRQLRDSDSG